MTDTMDPAEVATRLDAVRARIAAAGGDPEVVKVLAVTKGFGIEAAAAALDVGLDQVGENYADELALKARTLPQARWHYLGTLQRRQIPAIAAAAATIESLARPVEAEALARAAFSGNVFVQLNLAGATGRNGTDCAGAADLVARARQLGLMVTGLMGVAPAPPADPRPGFEQLVALADELDLAERSIGMSGDLEAAVAAGSTLIRVGEALFGRRPARH